VTVSINNKDNLHHKRLSEYFIFGNNLTSTSHFLKLNIFLASSANYFSWIHLLWIIPLAFILLLVGVVIIICIKFRQPPLEEAIFVENNRRTCGRMESFPAFDLYLPPQMQSKQPTLLFLPGGLVSHTAYSIIVSKLSDQGILVILINAEPTRLPSPEFAISLFKVKKIIEQVENRFHPHHYVLDWCIGGHSMGAYGATRYVRDLGMTKCIIWGSRSAFALNSASSSDVKILVCNATNDGMLMNKKTHFPSHAIQVKIVGGNHAGFGHYGPQLFPQKDGERTISLEEQHNLTVKATVSFILSSSS
jgi:hypothetical protein